MCTCSWGSTLQGGLGVLLWKGMAAYCLWRWLYECYHAYQHIQEVSFWEHRFYPSQSQDLISTMREMISSIISQLYLCCRMAQTGKLMARIGSKAGKSHQWVKQVTLSSSDFSVPPDRLSGTLPAVSLPPWNYESELFVACTWCCSHYQVLFFLSSGKKGRSQSAPQLETAAGIL